MKAALLPDRGVVKVAGADAAKFLDGLVTADLDKVTPGSARYAALLTPQGKIIADFIVVKAERGRRTISWTARARWRRRWCSASTSTSCAPR